MKIVFDKEVYKSKNIGEIVETAVEAACDIGVAGIFWRAAEAATIGAHPVIRVCAKIGYGLFGAATGKMISRIVCDTFDVEDKINKRLGIEVKEETEVE